MKQSFWEGKRVFVTGHSGFMGGWLSLTLTEFGAKVFGFSLPPPTEPNFFTLVRLGERLHSTEGDVRNADDLLRAVERAQPEIIFHLAAQPLVRASYDAPVETYATNVMGTVHILEAARRVGSVRAIVNVTSDKCYENREWVLGYRETDAMGGFDPYSSSKGCSEIVTGAYRRSFFAGERPLGLASVRAGNVIGGGDWATDRLIPDFIRALTAGNPLRIRSPHAIRPWQHVLEPVWAYLLLAEKLCSEPAAYSDGWNIGPAEGDAKPVEWIVDRICSLWGETAKWELDGKPHPHEAHYLKLDCSKARHELGWSPRWTLEQCLEHLVHWYRSWLAGRDMRDVSLEQLRQFIGATYVEKV